MLTYHNVLIARLEGLRFYKGLHASRGFSIHALMQPKVEKRSGHPARIYSGADAAERRACRFIHEGWRLQRKQYGQSVASNAGMTKSSLLRRPCQVESLQRQTR